MTQSNCTISPRTKGRKSHLAIVQPYPGNEILKRFIDQYRKLRRRPPLCKRIFDSPPQKNITNERNHSLAKTIELSESPLKTDLLEIFRGYERFPFLSIYIHGSWADNSRTKFSDLDDFIVIDEAAIPNKQTALLAQDWLNQVDMKFCRIDPLQHHGHWLTTLNSLETYDQAFIPIEAIQGSIRIQGPRVINVNYSTTVTQVSLRKNIGETVKHIRRLSKKIDLRAINLYEMKEYIGMILILPAYVAQATGNRCNKKHAIENARQIFSGEACDAIKYASEIRNNWGRLTSTNMKNLRSYAKYVNNPHLFRYLSKSVSPRFNRNTLDQAPIVAINRLIDESLAITLGK